MDLEEEEVTASAVGKVVGDKTGNTSGIRSFMNSMWNRPKNLEIGELGENKF